ncbi:MAG: hypothetical protein JW812_02020, partial [Alphaproteobacteria bacterium]|nr:hypothetical protein [Alphaproteobacteria bacterium]
MDTQNARSFSILSPAFEKRPVVFVYTHEEECRQIEALYSSWTAVHTIDNIDFNRPLSPQDKQAISQVEKALRLKKPVIAVLPLSFLLVKMNLERSDILFSKGKSIPFETSIKKLTNMGYNRVSEVLEPGDFAIRGALIDIYPIGAKNPFRLDFFGDEIDQIRPFDPLTQRAQGIIDEIEVE